MQWWYWTPVLGGCNYCCGSCSICYNTDCINVVLKEIEAQTYNKCSTCNICNTCRKSAGHWIASSSPECWANFGHQTFQVMVSDQQQQEERDTEVEYNDDEEEQGHQQIHEDLRSSSGNFRLLFGNFFWTNHNILAHNLNSTLFGCPYSDPTVVPSWRVLWKNLKKFFCVSPRSR